MFSARISHHNEKYYSNKKQRRSLYSSGSALKKGGYFIINNPPMADFIKTSIAVSFQKLLNSHVPCDPERIEMQVP